MGNHKRQRCQQRETEKRRCSDPDQTLASFWWFPYRSDCGCGLTRNTGRTGQGLKSKCQIARRMEARLTILLQTVMYDPLERRRNVLICFREIGWIFLQDCAHRFGCGFATKSATARKHLIENGAERKDVRTMIYGLPSQLLRRHVTNCAHHHARVGVDAPRRYLRLRLGINSSRQLRQAKVQNLEPLVFGDKEILLLEVPMKDSLL